MADLNNKNIVCEIKEIIKDMGENAENEKE